MSRTVRPTQGLRNRQARRTKTLRIALSEEEHAALFASAGFTGEHAGVWARDVLMARAAGLHRQRNLLDGVAA